ncbi:hypothetical protein [Terrimonas alba]|uniref:hypothetical protein n=1 Tax=Terrimonas alba TaxID=3349636 RepID=UPI0035F4F8DE
MNSIIWTLGKEVDYGQPGTLGMEGMKKMLAIGETQAENYVASLSPGDVDWA